MTNVRVPCSTILLTVLAACADGAVTDPPSPDFAKGSGGGTPNPEITFYDATNRGRFLYVMNVDGSARTRVATLVDGGSRSTWSRAGSGTSTQPYQLAYADLIYAGTNDCSLFIVDLWVSGSTVGANTPRKVSTSAPSCYLAWSPIGPELAYATGFYDGSVPGHIEIWLIGADGSNERLLYSSTRALAGLDWTRDGTHLVVVEKSNDYTVEGDRLLLIDAASGVGSVLYQSAANISLPPRIDVANRSNDVLFSMRPYSGTPSTYWPETIYRLPVGPDFTVGTPQLIIEGAAPGSWSPDDASLVYYWNGFVYVYTLATGASRSIGKGSAPHWRPQ